MSNDALDLAFARHVRQIGLVTPEQVTSALQSQAKSVQSGTHISFAEALVQMGLLTAAQRETLEKKVKDQQAGVQQLGPYKLIKKLGEGGMGAVYLATDPSTQKQVAVKVLPRHMGSNAEFVKRFKREADAATKLKHPNIISAFATGEDLGYHYYVMEYCEGTPLDKLLAVEKQLPVAKALDLVLQAARGLQFAHAEGIIHRDIKPSNIIVAKDGTARILDLGLSKNLGDSSMSFKTVTGAVLGTPHYISPEQAQGEKYVDGRSDIYSLGATLYHLLTGQTPFDGTTALEILSKHVNTVLPNPQDLREDIPDPVVHVLQRMMAKEPDDRYRDCEPLLADLEAVAGGTAPKSQMISPALSTIAPPARRSLIKKRSATLRRTTKAGPPKTALYAGIGVAAVAAILLAVFLMRPDPPGRDPVTVARPNPVGKTPDPGKSPFDPAAWEKSVAELPPEAQVKAVVARLKDLNPGYDGTERHEVSHGKITRLDLGHVALQDLSPVRAFPGLVQLDCSGSSVSDLSALKDARLVALLCAGTKVADLKPLRGLKDLKILSLKSTPVRDLSPLSGMELWQLNLRGTAITDFSPLQGVKLRELLADVDPKRDAAALQALAGLEKINDLPIDEFWPREKPVVPVPAPPTGPEELLRAVLLKLKQLNPDFDGRESHIVQDGSVVELTISAIGIQDLAPLAALAGLRRLDVSGYWDPAEKREYRGTLTELAPLKGMKLEALRIHHTDVPDLEALRGMRLESLDVLSTRVSSLAPIKGMPLKKLEASYCHLKDLSPIEGMPLVDLKVRNNEITNHEVLRSLLTLRELVADLEPKRDAALVASIKSLVTVNEVPVAAFLNAGAAPLPKPVPVAVPPPDAGSWKNAVDLLALIDPQRDAVRGVWKKENGRLISEFAGNGVLRIPYEPPPEYDFRIVFTRAGSQCATAQFLVREGRSFFFEMGGYGNVTSGFSQVGGRGSNENPTKGSFVPRDGLKYVCVVQVRRDRVTALIDDKKLTEWTPAMGELSTDSGWCVDVPNLLGLGNCDTLTTFESVQVREVTGKGRLRTSLATPIDPAFLKTVAALGPQDQVKKVLEKLKELNPAFDQQSRHKSENDKVVEFAISTQRVTDIWPVRALASLRKLELGEEGAGMLSDISALKGLKLTELSLLNTRVSDLSALKDMPLVKLQVSGTPVKDFTPLKGKSSLKTINEQPAADFFKNPKEAWTALFDGRTNDCLRNPRGWRAEKGALVNDPDEVNSAQTKFEFSDGELRIRFEAKGLDAATFRVRQSESGAIGVFFDGLASRALDGKPHELTFTMRGAQVTSVLDGKALPLYENKPVRTGCFQFNGTNGTLRITSIEFRELK